MKRIALALVLSVAIWQACTQAPQAPQAETSEAQAPPNVPAQPGAKSLSIAAAQSKVIAIGTKVTGRHEIAFPIKEGQITVSDDKCIAGGKITMDLSKLEVLDLQGDLKAKLEGHLRSEDFFLTEKYPEAVFEITGCEKANGDTVFLSGNLTMRGQTKNIKFPAVLHLHDGGLRAKANFNINRQEWGIAYKGKADDLIRDEVNINLDITAQ